MCIRDRPKAPARADAPPPPGTGALLAKTSVNSLQLISVKFICIHLPMFDTLFYLFSIGKSMSTKRQQSVFKYKRSKELKRLLQLLTPFI